MPTRSRNDAASFDQRLERIVDADSDSVVRAYERKIKEMEIQKAVLADKMANGGEPLKGVSETYRTAFDFLGNPLNLWRSPRAEDRRAVLKLALTEQLPDVPGKGCRTAKISNPFKALGDINISEK